MIKFSLLCARGHGFESWFSSGEAFETQAHSGRVLCPHCQTPDVKKAIMAPAIALGRGGEPAGPLAQGETPAKMALLDPRDLETRALLTAIHKKIYDEAEDVGTRFAEEARKIHEGYVRERPIHGMANAADARALMEEGIDILPVPSLPDELN
jgi:hypothetical protein